MSPWRDPYMGVSGERTRAASRHDSRHAELLHELLHELLQGSVLLLQQLCSLSIGTVSGTATVYGSNDLVGRLLY